MATVKRALTPLPLRSELLHYIDDSDAGPSSLYADSPKRDAREFRRGTVPLQARDLDERNHDNDNLSHRHRLASVIKSAARSGFHRGSIPDDLLLRSSGRKLTGGRDNGSSSKDRSRGRASKNANHQNSLRLPPVHVLSMLEPLLEAIDVEFGDTLDIRDFSADFQVERMDNVERATIENASARHKARLSEFHPVVERMRADEQCRSVYPSTKTCCPICLHSDAPRIATARFTYSGCQLRGGTLSYRYI